MEKAKTLSTRTECPCEVERTRNPRWLCTIKNMKTQKKWRLIESVYDEYCARGENRHREKKANLSLFPRKLSTIGARPFSCRMVLSNFDPSGKRKKTQKWFCFVFNARRAGKEILKDQGCLADEWTAGKCAATLHAWVLDRETVQKCDRLATQPEMFQGIKPSKLCPSLTEKKKIWKRKTNFDPRGTQQFEEIRFPLDEQTTERSTYWTKLNMLELVW